MCLMIKECSHVKICGRYLPKIAMKNMLVHKYLKVEHEQAYTPVQETFCEFKNGVCILSTKTFGYSDFGYSHEIYQGIHAKTVRKNSDWIPCIRFDAIIPKGTLYYIGYNNEVVSKKLMIFKPNAFKEWSRKNTFIKIE